MSLSIDGLSSGMNTSEIVQQLLAIERRPLIQMQERIQTHQQRMDAWRDVNMRLASLDTKLGDLLLSSTYEARAATSSVPEIATATASTSAMPATYEILVTQLATTQRIVGAKFGLDADPPLDVQAGTIRINEIDIDIEAGASLQDIAATINGTEGIEVRATIVDDRLVLEGMETGAEIVLSDDVNAGILDHLGLLEGHEGSRDASTAIFTINGITVERNSNVINDVVEGITFTLKSEGETVIDITKNADSAVGKIKEVVEQINSAMTFISSRLEKEAILQGDSALMRLQIQLRTTLMDRVNDGTGMNQLSAIGISFSRQGTMEIDEAKLREALEEDAQAVYKLFAGDADSDDGFDGVARKARELIKSYTQTDGIISNRRDMFQKQIKSTEDSIERLEMRLERQEDRLFRQFGALEQAMAALQSQSAWLQTQLMQMAGMQQR